MARAAKEAVETAKELPSPRYSGKNAGKGRAAPLAIKAKAERIDFRGLCDIGVANRIRVGVGLGYLPQMEGAKCPRDCGAKLSLHVFADRGSPGISVNVGDVQVSVPTLCRHRCGDWTCSGNKMGIAVQSEEGALISLGGSGRAPASEGLLAVHLACVPGTARHPSRGDCTVVQGISKDSMALCLDRVRRRMAYLSLEEQARIKFKGGMLVELDECKPECPGYRLLWNRWLIVVERGNGANMVLIQLPWETSMAGGGGAPLSGVQCDEAVRKHLGRGAIALTDGADCYKAFAAGDLICSPCCDRKGCLERARAARSAKQCLGSRPKHGRERVRAHYRKLAMSHDVVSHKKEWVLVKAVRVQDKNGNVRMVKLKHGTEAADGNWDEVKTALPSSIKSSDHDRIAEYAPWNRPLRCFVLEVGEG
ncbi:unnamed protein product [Prorocentrum cordatum]|uniref:ISXO2-like transposase domain-containing protein n=1 Tax=Prorocentrum cordatum TaxID=2364126 RepID=A0ABN9PTV6_9DINO|nr:unnamed protein product [Polarella glacialis]